MPTTRLEAFSDGVIAILITIMVLELRAPEGATFAALSPVIPAFFTYVMSFVYLGIYWNNHHHMLQAAHHVHGGALWANLHLLFWLSLVPFATGWMETNHFAALPTAMYGVVLLLSATAYKILQTTLLWEEGSNHLLRDAIGSDVKGYVSLALYLLAVPLAFVSPMLAVVIYVLVALFWLVPDRRIERKVGH